MSDPSLNEVVSATATAPTLDTSSTSTQAIVVLKFGGTSVASAKTWRTIASLVRKYQAKGETPILVCSALAGVTDLLQRIVNNEQADDALAEIQQKHWALAHAFGVNVEAAMGEAWLSLQDLYAKRRDEAAWHAQVMACGELMSTRLGASILQTQGIAAYWRDAREALRCETTDKTRKRHYLNAEVKPASNPQLVQKWREQTRFEHDAQQTNEAAAQCWITQGFIARDDDHATVLLGRGGSDTSAVYMGVVLDAKRVEIWTDVPGMFSANPKVVSSARQLRHLSYREAQEIAATGAKVLHPRCITPLREAAIPLHIDSTMQPELQGSVISDEARDFGAQVKAICCQRGITLISMETLGMWQQVGFLAEAFQRFQRFGLSIDLISTSESNVTVTLDTHAQMVDESILDALKTELEAICRVKIITDCASVSLVGRGIRTILHRLGPALELFEERKIHLLSQAANDLNLSVVVESDYADSLVRQLHHLLIPRDARIPEESVFGPLWQHLVQPETMPQATRQPAWWREQSQTLLERAEDHAAAYVYHLPTVRQRVQSLQQLDSVSRILYAMKANSHPEVLRCIRAQGVGFDCVSWAEIQYLRELFPDLSPQEVLFTPNFAPREEYAEALAWGCTVTLDNLAILQQWPDLWRGQRAFLRVDPGQGHGHHQKVKTAGVHSKFGVPLGELEEVAELCAALNLTIHGLHVHIGSGLTLADNWRRNAELLIQLTELFPAVENLDLGGGLGVPTKAGDSELDLKELDAGLREIQAHAPKALNLWLEPGRYLVSEAGVLLVHVTQTKGKGQVRYVGVTAGMNALIRPTLYGAYHDIVNLSRLDEKRQELVNIVGPICETGDILGLDRMLAPCQEGDVLLVANGGAYGAVMASRYNLRPLVAEVVLDPARQEALDNLGNVA
ncbi:MAG: bifunctional aspartate kinase/diaminopimelate decarboxylase [Xanthomonadales bacterium]|nr:bifunctional aspartate kinase/diaminopimelate decarboxylase [Xanthomonadales bacterium]